MDTEWEILEGKISHSYYEKEMKTPYQVMARSAMGKQSKIAILGNELIRRLKSRDKAGRDTKNSGTLYNAVENLRIFKKRLQRDCGVWSGGVYEKEEEKAGREWRKGL